MSLEAKIEALTTAVQVLTEVMTSGGQPVVNGKVNVSSKAPAAKPVAKAAPAEEGDEAEAPAPKAAAKPAAKAAAPAAKTDDAIDPAYAPVKAAILDAIAKNFRPQIAAMFKKHGVKNGQELDPSAYDEVLGEIDAIVNGEAELA